ncbi:MAG: SAM-dependent methyltransferase [Nocardioidaceae bacterium]
MTERTDWRAWHAPYDDPASPLSRRLGIVRSHVRAWLDAQPDGPARIVSACAGRGLDLIPELAGRRDAARFRATLVEYDSDNAAMAAELARAAGLDVAVRERDAGVTDAYTGAVPADLVLLCGVFGNVSDEDVRRTVAAAPQLCARGATVIWTRHRRAPDLTPAIRRWLTDAGFEERAFDSPGPDAFSVGVHRLVGEPVPLRIGQSLFTFAC